MVTMPFGGAKMFSWDAVAVARNGNRAVANLHAGYGDQIKRLHAEYGAELKKYSDLVDEWIAHARRLEAENAQLKRHSGANDSVKNLHKLVGEWQAKAARLEAENAELRARVPA